MRHRILLQTNPTFLKTGLAENARELLKYLYKTQKYEIGHYCSQISIDDPNLKFSPWKSWGCVPNDPNILNELNRDPGKARDVSYGSWNIENVIKEFKPTIWIGSDDPWAFGKGNYIDKPWFRKINSILHITIDSLPVLEQALEQALNTKYYFSWAKFAAQAMHKLDSKFNHVGQIYGAMDIDKFSPILNNEKKSLRKQFNIDENCMIFLFVGRNQLRKQFVHTIQAFAQFKKDHPQFNSKLYFHTSFSEKHAGWDIPKMAGYYGVKLEDILCTYVCKHCGQWHIRPYMNEDIDCPHCGAKNSCVTANIVHGVPDQQMKYVYGVADACVSAISSGGQEYHNVQSLLCGKPLASTNYSSGQDFCEQDFVYKLGFSSYIEHGTNFIKSTTNINDIKSFMFKICQSSARDLQEISERGREWAVNTFSISVIGKQWENLFDSMSFPDWETITLMPEQKNENFPFPNIDNENDFISTLYKEVLKMNEPLHGDGFKHWKSRLKDGMKREDVYNYFISVAKTENLKNNPRNHDIWSMIDKNGKTRVLLVIKESIGDIMLATALFKSAKEQHPNSDIYVMCDPQYHEILLGNEYIYKVIPFISVLEHEMIACGAGQKEGFFHAFYHIPVQTQKFLSYLSQPSPDFDLLYANSN